MSVLVLGMDGCLGNFPQSLIGSMMLEQGMLGRRTSKQPLYRSVVTRVP